ncbi:hypothetical protein D9C73_010917 [Collichthys lucidus]|uniref:Uncharacterized protein n=1 Tax=Collichthys lucidus TaxID=240159 RepID=A0A4U5UP89_COLLU|nr:hypothetical protein D9C73_010917 [Collichthys lucidus]
MESVFFRFDSFDFESDRRFVDGLKTVRDRDRDKVLDMKLFFYNRFVEPIDRTSYKQWSSASPQVTQTDCGDEATPSGSDSDISSNQTAETSAETEATQQLSFAEVMRLVQEGKEVPGAKKMDVKPTNQNPTPSAMERRLKPWETSK